MLTDEMKARLVLENDEVRLRTFGLSSPPKLTVCIQMCYDPDDLLPICNELDIPIVVCTPAIDQNTPLTLL